MVKREEDDPASHTSEEDMDRRDRNGRDGGRHGDDPVIGSAMLRPVFLGNLYNTYTPEDVEKIFTKPIVPDSARDLPPVPVERVDLKRGYCFVFLKPVSTQRQKEHAERLVSVINRMEVPRVSDSLRAEFARGDGRVKRKEDERRKNIAPSDTLFVVNFNEATTRREDLQSLFEPFGELIRIDMKRNYAFVQFHTIEQATRAKESINGGKLDQSILTVEYVARPRVEDLRRSNSGGNNRDGGRDSAQGDRRLPPRVGGAGGGRYDDRGPPRRYDDGPRGDRYGNRGGDRRPYGDRGGYEGLRSSRSPPPSYRRRGSSRSRSRSPPRYSDRRDRSPPRRYDDRYGDEYDRRRSPPMGDCDRDRGYRP